MAGAGYKLFQTGDVLTAAQVNTYLNEQTVMVFASAAARTSALTSVLAEGMVSYLQDTNAVEVYNGSAWVSVSGGGDVTEVQAGTGISVASGTGPIPVVTNTMATAVDAKGDLIVGTGADTFARLAVGTNGHTLVADSAEATGLKWAAPAGGLTYAVFVDEKTTGTHGGTFTSGAWRTRDINTSKYNNISGASIGSNQITLPAGTYRIDASCPGISINQFASRLYNITDSSVTILGSTEYTDQANSVHERSVIQGIFTIAGTKVFEIQNQCGSTKSTTGFGQATNYQAEIYTIVNITKI
jgi:hypothetical protein